MSKVKEGHSVLVVMGSKSDLPVMKSTEETLNSLGIFPEMRIASAHRTPDMVKEIIEDARERGIRVIIAGAGYAAHLAGFIAAHTTLPVIGVPLSSSDLNGIDALLSTVQMPPGIPVATVGIGKAGARNAAILAAQMLSLGDEKIRERIIEFREEMKGKVIKADRELK